MKTKIMGNIAIISSSLTQTEIKGLERHNPDALCLKDEKGSTKYRITSTSGAASITRNGVSFNEIDETTGQVYITVALPVGTENKAVYIAENFGKALTDLRTVEAAASEAFAEVTANIEAVADAIDVIEAV